MFKVLLFFSLLCFTVFVKARPQIYIPSSAAASAPVSNESNY